ncbi:hypothetical protein MMC10_002171 [Thelotrema lepadinum]|nr:hypothetical protein [Thelotrema lepadinum]
MQDSHATFAVDQTDPLPNENQSIPKNKKPGRPRKRPLVLDENGQPLPKRPRAGRPRNSDRKNRELAQEKANRPRKRPGARKKDRNNPRIGVRANSPRSTRAPRATVSALLADDDEEDNRQRPAKRVLPVGMTGRPLGRRTARDEAAGAEASNATSTAAQSLLPSGEGWKQEALSLRRQILIANNMIEDRNKEIKRLRRERRALTQTNQELTEAAMLPDGEDDASESSQPSFSQRRRSPKQLQETCQERSSQAASEIENNGDPQHGNPSSWTTFLFPRTMLASRLIRRAIQMMRRFGGDPHQWCMIANQRETHPQSCRTQVSNIAIRPSFPTQSARNDYLRQSSPIQGFAQILLRSMVALKFLKPPLSNYTE